MECRHTARRYGADSGQGVMLAEPGRRRTRLCRSYPGELRFGLCSAPAQGRDLAIIESMDEKTGEIVFRDQNGDVYVVRVEITSYPSIDLGYAYFSDKSISFEHGQWMYPESIYIGGIEQNVLFGDLDYSAYVQYFRSFLGYD